MGGEMRAAGGTWNWTILPVSFTDNLILASVWVVLLKDMGKLQEFEITFTNNKVVYNPGESISGTVRIKTSHSLQFKGKRRLHVLGYMWL